MKGLFLKDLYFTLQQKKMFLIILFMFVIFYFSQGIESAPFTIAYISLLGGMFVLSTISYDEYENSIVYLFTMPIQRKEYVKEKYLFGIFGLVSFWSVVTAAYVCLDFGNAMETLIGALAILAVMLVFEMIMIPIQLKFGGDKGRLALIGIVVAGMLLMLLVKGVANRLIGSSAEIEAMIYEILEKVSSVRPWIAVVAGAAVLTIGTYISYRISLKVIENREY